MAGCQHHRHRPSGPGLAQVSHQLHHPRCAAGLLGSRRDSRDRRNRIVVPAQQDQFGLQLRIPALDEPDDRTAVNGPQQHPALDQYFRILTRQISQNHRVFTWRIEAGKIRRHIQELELGLFPVCPARLQEDNGSRPQVKEIHPSVLARIVDEHDPILNCAARGRLQRTVARVQQSAADSARMHSRCPHKIGPDTGQPDLSAASLKHEALVHRHGHPKPVLQDLVNAHRKQSGAHGICRRVTPRIPRHP